MLTVVTVIAELIKESKPMTTPEETAQVAKSFVNKDKGIVFLMQ